MMHGSQEEPTTAEWKVLKIVWEKGPLAAREVIDLVAGKSDWSTSTVKTLLRRLVEKGHLRTKRVGNSFLYSSARSPLKSLRKAGDALLERAGDSTVGSLLAYMVRRSHLSDSDLEQLRQLIDDKCGDEQ